MPLKMLLQYICFNLDCSLNVPLTQAVVKAMEQLAQGGKIREKVYGKQKIYFADQVCFHTFLTHLQLRCTFF